MLFFKKLLISCFIFQLSAGDDPVLTAQENPKIQNSQKKIVGKNILKCVIALSIITAIGYHYFDDIGFNKPIKSLPHKTFLAFFKGSQVIAEYIAHSMNKTARLYDWVWGFKNDDD